jgi:hypothetical protein
LFWQKKNKKYLRNAEGRHICVIWPYFHRDIFVVLITSDVMFVLHRKGFSFHYFVQIAYSLIEEQEGEKRACDAYISFVGLLADPRYCGTFQSLCFLELIQ